MNGSYWDIQRLSLIELTNQLSQIHGLKRNIYFFDKIAYPNDIAFHCALHVVAFAERDFAVAGRDAKRTWIFVDAVAAADVAVVVAAAVDDFESIEVMALHLNRHSYSPRY